MTAAAQVPAQVAWPVRPAKAAQAASLALPVAESEPASRQTARLAPRVAAVVMALPPHRVPGSAVLWALSPQRAQVAMPARPPLQGVNSVQDFVLLLALDWTARPERLQLAAPGQEALAARLLRRAAVTIAPVPFAPV